MKVPLEITYRDIESTPAVSAYIKTRTQKLELFCKGIIKCHVVIEQAPKHQRRRQHNTRITLMMPRYELTCHDNVSENLYKSIHTAFDKIQRQLDDCEHTLRGFVKQHDAPHEGTVARLFAQDRFGVIEGLEGNEYYFNDSNLCNGDFKKLHEGARVKFIEFEGDEGLQAHRVRLVRRRE